MVDKSIFYNFDDVLSRNGVYNFIVGGRGIGKTYGAKKMVIRDAIRHGHEFMYVRRFKEELKIAKGSFFDDIVQEFPDWQFKAEGDYAYIARVEGDVDKPNWRRIGHFVPLSTTQSRKSTPYPNVRTIIFDEFIQERGRRYLPEELTVFNNFYNTVDRYRDKVRVLFLANSVSIDNDYFVKLEIRPDQGGKWSRSRDGYVVCHFPDADAYRDVAMGSRFGRFIAGTEYEEYAMGNKFADAHHKMIGKKGSEARYMYTLDTGKGVFTVWLDMTGGEYYLQSKRPRVEAKFTTSLRKVDEDTRYVLKSYPRVKLISQAFARGMLIFDKPATRNIFLELLK